MCDILILDYFLFDGNNVYFYYILINEVLNNSDEIKCVFTFSIFSMKKFVPTAMKHTFRIFSVVLWDYVLPKHKI
jgi:hypothetical protein